MQYPYQKPSTTADPNTQSAEVGFVAIGPKSSSFQPPSVEERILSHPKRIKRPADKIWWEKGYWYCYISCPNSGVTQPTKALSLSDLLDVLDGTWPYQFDFVINSGGLTLADFETYALAEQNVVWPHERVMFRRMYLDGRIDLTLASTMYATQSTQ